ncbi:hypothetical protein SLE2022_223100 [Rubroshorea leprosula]
MSLYRSIRGCIYINGPMQDESVTSASNFSCKNIPGRKTLAKMTKFSAFVLLVIVIFVAFGNGPMVASAKTCADILNTVVGCVPEQCTIACKNVYGPNAVGKCTRPVDCTCSHPC